ncbi:MAG: glutamate 5-kinase [Proteobacteria bacterium SG_bin5]|nr:glutamate 5-kinase [Sphingomonas sp.]OQW43170.1 MAG: glutamate 5-kinase [Proteobacteria bacterium SG_bin5]
MLLNAPRLVIKIGSSLLVSPRGAVRRAWLANLAADLAALVAQGQQPIIVSSGAIALGARRLKLARGGRATLEDAQAAAATGQIALARAWAEALGAKGLVAAQLLLTLDDLDDRRRYLNAATTLARLLALGVVPVVNENDSVATEEIRFGDNDRLAARVALAAGGQAVLLLSDVAGLYDRPPEEAGALLIPMVADIDRLDARLGTSGAMGTGGMAAKLAAARLATEAGVALAIVSGREDHPLARFAATGRGTLFSPAADARPARKAWLAAGRTAKGQFTADAGAIAALRQGKSLLPAGVTRVHGKFARGDLVVILDERGTPVARGLSEYDAGDATRIAGQRSAAVAAILGHAPRAALVHRNHMALL